MSSLAEQVYALCVAIEKLPASEEQTCVSVMASRLHADVAAKERECEELRNRMFDVGNGVSCSADFVEAAMQIERELRQSAEAQLAAKERECEEMKAEGEKRREGDALCLDCSENAVEAIGNAERRAESAKAERDGYKARCEALEWLVEVQAFYMSRLRNPGAWSTPGQNEIGMGRAWARRSASNDELRFTHKAALAATEVK